MSTVLAIDIGGTKTLAALVQPPAILEEREIPTPRTANIEDWLVTLNDLVQHWQGSYQRVGVAVTGLIDNGYWSALNPNTLPVPGGFQLPLRLGQRLGKNVLAVNDAQAAAWGEHRFGAGQTVDTLFYLTISTGIGGGAVINGKLLTGRNGLAGSAGQLRLPAGGRSQRLEDAAAGQWIAEQAALAGHPGNARSVFAAAAAGQRWAERIIDRSAAGSALLLHNLQLLFAPDRIVVGGGIGLAPGYLQRIGERLGNVSALERPELYAGALGKYAGVIGVADLARTGQPDVE
jgi:predicted NBD/HSP70 family sugar kinase